MESQIIASATGYSHSLVLTKNCEVLAWGNNFEGQLGDGTTKDRKKANIIEALPKKSIIAIAAGHSYSLALTKTGQVYAWE